MGQNGKTVRELLDQYHELGIPHFQRGLVWHDDSVSLLLESLYYSTPIGSFVLWETDTAKQGMPLTKEPFKYLIIDGQQRIRTLYGVFYGTDEPGDEEGPKAWCVNLREIKSINQYFPKSNKEFSLFLKLRDPLFKETEGKQQRRKTPFDRNFIPLKLLLDFDKNKSQIRELLETDKSIDIDGMVEELREKVLPNIDGMLRQPVFVTKLEKGRPFEEVIELYNRINSGGKRVDAEEIAFATLVALDVENADHIQRIFTKFHNQERAGEFYRDSMLKREKERNFGFKLFIRTFVQVCAYHFGYSLGYSGISFSLLEGGAFQKMVGELEVGKKREFLGRMWKITEDVLDYTKTLLREQLKCDDLRFLPDTFSLLPIFQLLIKFHPDKPGSSYAFSPAVDRNIAVLCLQLALFSRSNQKIMKLVDEVKDKDTLEEALDELNRKTKVKNDEKDEFGEVLKNTVTLNDRVTLLLYWLLRAQGAKDFSYKENELKKLDKFPHLEMDINTETKPEKQHIVPYSRLKGILGITDKMRQSSHIANNIGNITYISHNLNSFDFGVGQVPLNLLKEDPENLKRHFLNDADMLTAYEKQRLYESESVGKNQSMADEFDKFISRRRKLIADGFISWIAMLSHFPCEPCPAPPAQKLGKSEEFFVKKPGVDNRRGWDEISFFEYIKTQFSPDEQGVFSKLYRFSVENAGKVSWGTGAARGSFSPIFSRVSPKTLYTLRSDGDLSFNFGGMGNTAEIDANKERFKEELEKNTQLSIPSDFKGAYPRYPWNQWASEVDGIITAINNLLGS